MTSRPQHAFGYRLADMTVGRLLADKAQRNGDKTWLKFAPDGRRFSYAELDALTNRHANGLLERGIAHGTHVAVWMDNSPELLFTLFALGKIGAVAIPLNTAARGQLLQYYLNHADATAIVADAPLLDRLMEVAGGLPKLATVIVHHEGAEGCGPWPKAPDGQALTFFDLGELRGANDAPPAVEVRHSDLAYLMFTSGTTGPSKANMLTQSTAWSWGMSTANSFGYRASDTAYLVPDRKLTFSRATTLARSAQFTICI